MLSGVVIECPCGIPFKYTEMTQTNDMTDSSTFHKWIANGKNKSMTKSDINLKFSLIGQKIQIYYIPLAKCVPN